MFYSERHLQYLCRHVQEHEHWQKPLANLQNLPSSLSNRSLGITGRTLETMIHVEGNENGETCAIKSLINMLQSISR